LTVGSIQAGSKSNVIPDRAELQLNIRTYSRQTRTTMLDAIRRIVSAECQASGSPREPEFEVFDRYPLTDNDLPTTTRVSDALTTFFGGRCQTLPMQTASEDFSDIPTALGAPYTYWGIGGVDPAAYQNAADRGQIDRDIPVNHSPAFAPVIGHWNPGSGRRRDGMASAQLTSSARPSPHGNSQTKLRIVLLDISGYGFLYCSAGPTFSSSATPCAASTRFYGQGLTSAALRDGSDGTRRGTIG
jgi:hypothetical protein